MLFKLAARNVRRQTGSYIIYFITVSFTIALIFAVNNMIYSDVMNSMVEQFGEFIQPILLFVSCVLCVIMAFVLSYATNFLLRKRKKEFGLYLIMGMSRSDIIYLFIGEMIITFLISLVFGIALGLGFYQAMMAIFTDFIDLTYTPGGYTISGFGWTFLQVGVMFVLASLASLGYLKVAKISTLLQGTKVVEKKVGFPVLWVVVFIISAIVLAIASVSFVRWLKSDNFALHLDVLTIIVIALFASIFFLPMSSIKVLFWLLLKRDCCSSRGIGRFTIRQLSSRLNSNSVMIGVLSLLLSVAIVGPNMFSSMSGIIDMDIDKEYMYDISLYSSFFYKGDYREQLDIIEEYADIDRYCVYTLYGERTDNFDKYMEESDFKNLCALSGYQAPDLNGGYLFCTQPMFYNGSLFKYTPMEESDDSCIGQIVCPAGFISESGYIGSWYVVPDGKVPQNTDYSSRLAVYLKSSDYDGVELYNVLYMIGDSKIGVMIKERERLLEIRQIGLFLLGDLYISAVFLLLSVAVLALKILSMVTEDRERYRVIWKLGASQGMLGRSLFLQFFLLFFTPFIVPLLLNFPLYNVIKVMLGSRVEFLSSSTISLQLLGFSGILLAVFAIYFMASYLMAWSDIKRNIHTDARN